MRIFRHKTKPVIYLATDDSLDGALGIEFSQGDSGISLVNSASVNLSKQYLSCSTVEVSNE